MKGIFKLAYKLLINDKAKFTALLIGNTFAVFGMMFAASMFVGVLFHSFSTVTNIGASIWVMDPAVQTVANSIGMPDYVLDAVRSMQGVKYAVPLYSGGALVKLPNDGATAIAGRRGVHGSRLTKSTAEEGNSRGCGSPGPRGSSSAEDLAGRPRKAKNGL